MALFDQTALAELAQKLGQNLPPQLNVLKDDFQENLRVALAQALAKMDLVTREEFEVQSQVLAKTRAKLVALEERVAALEDKSE